MDWIKRHNPETSPRVLGEEIAQIGGMKKLKATICIVSIIAIAFLSGCASQLAGTDDNLNYTDDSVGYEVEEFGEADSILRYPLDYNEAPEVPYDDPIFEEGSVMLISNGIAHEPSIHFLHGASSGMSATGIPFEFWLAHNVSTMQEIQYTGDLQIWVNGVYGQIHSKHENSWQHEGMTLIGVSAENFSNGIAEIVLPAEPGIYLLYVDVTWSGEGYEFTRLRYVFKIIKSVEATETNRPSLVRYYQRDSRWATIPFGSFSLARGGCGPTAVAMVVSTLRNTEVLPCYVATWGSRFYVEGVGSAHALFTSSVTHNHFGLNYRAIPISNDAEILEALRGGAMMITSIQSTNSPNAREGNQGLFTINPDGEGGHIAILHGATEDGNILVASSFREDLGEDTEGWSLDTVRQEIHSGINVLWTFTVDETAVVSFGHCHDCYVES